MSHLSPTQLKEAAPAAVVRHPNATEERIIDTSAFIRDLRALDFLPVFAAQGTAHSDAEKTTVDRGRHMVVMANGNFALALLNSHVKDRPAWMAAGIWHDGGLLLGPAVRLKRWKGYQEPMEILMAQESDILARISALSRTRAGAVLEITKTTFARRFATSGFLPKATKIAYGELLCQECPTLFDVALNAWRVIQESGHASSRRNRKMKPVRRPESLFHAASQAMRFANEASANRDMPAPAWAYFKASY